MCIRRFPFVALAIKYQKIYLGIMKTRGESESIFLVWLCSEEATSAGHRTHFFACSDPNLVNWQFLSPRTLAASAAVASAPSGAFH